MPPGTAKKQTKKQKTSSIKELERLVSQTIVTFCYGLSSQVDSKLFEESQRTSFLLLLLYLVFIF